MGSHRSEARGAGLVLIVLLVLTAGFCNLGKPTIHEWDEARHGQIALEMISNGDYLRYTFAGQPEQWFSKPPLAIWAIVGSYRLFGENEFALRFPSALAAVLTVLLCCLITRRYAKSAAVWTALILVTSTGLFGKHVGRTGDTDAILICCEVAFAFFALRYVDRGERRSDAILAGVLLGLAFLAKGVAALPIAAGIALYALYRRRVAMLVRKPEVATGALLFAGFIAAWLWISQVHGYRFSKPDFPGRSNFETMIIYDGLATLLSGTEGHGGGINPLYPLKTLDLLWSPWIYVFYVLGIAGLMRAFRGRRAPAKAQRGERDGSIEQDAGTRVLAPAIVLILPLFLLLIFMRTRLPWYGAPMIPFLAIVLAVWVDGAWRRDWLRIARPFVIAVLAVAFVREGTVVFRPKLDRVGEMIRANRTALRNAERIVAAGDLRQHHRLGLAYSGREVTVLPATATREAEPGTAAGLPAGSVLYLPAGTDGDPRARLVAIERDGQRRVIGAAMP